MIVPPEMVAAASIPNVLMIGFITARNGYLNSSAFSGATGAHGLPSTAFIMPPVRASWPSHGPLVYTWHMRNAKASARTDTPRHGRLFRNGRNQALWIPRELEFAADEVLLRDDPLIVDPACVDGLAEILPRLRTLAENFPEVSDRPVRTQDVF